MGFASDLTDTPFDRANAFLKLLSHPDYDYYEKPLAGALTLLSASHSPTPSNPHHATTTYSLRVPRALCNATGALHGGAVATIFDLCTSLTIEPAAREGFWDTGHVSRTLNVTYLRPVNEGEEVLVESEVVGLGKRMGLVKGVMRERGTGRVAYVCEHGKVAVGGGVKL